MRYADFIKGNEGFQYSINIQYDLMNPGKIKGYIPTRKSIEILKEYLLNVVVDDREKATVLIGPYGKGKSHLLLVLLGLMSGNNQIPELNGLIEKIKLIDKTCAEVAENVLENKKYLPVVINFNSGDLNQAFLVALNQALKNEKIQDILPETYFDAALSVLDGWEKYEDTIVRVKKLINKKCNLELDSFRRKLKSFNGEIFEVFKKIFKEITSGVEFNPFINTDVVKLYEQANHILKEQYNYDGMVIVFDEFSKFIEASADVNSAMNLKILQDFAELSSRSKSPQMHLICVTHKTINEYISKIPQEKIDAWRAIEGRFKEILFNASSQQNYELISNAIVKDLNKVKDVLSKMELYSNKRVWSAQGLFDYDNEEYREQIIEGCFPLNPYSTYTLPIISEKVAQNERTLFTYLSKDEPNSLIDLVNDTENEFDLVTIDKLYDYFEPLFRKETFNESIHDVWMKADAALSIVYFENQKKIIKALGIIRIVNDLEVLPPTEEVLANVLNMSKKEISEAIKELISTSGVLVLRRSSGTLDFTPKSSVNVNDKITTLVESKFKVVNLADTYNELVNMKYILPKKYNDEYKMTRFFKRTFMTLNQINSYMSSEKLLNDYSADGLIIDLIIQNDEDKSKAKEWWEKINDNRIILVAPVESSKIINDIADYKAIVHLKADNEFLKEDAAIESQLNLLLDDVVEKITNYINRMYDITSKNSYIYIDSQTFRGVKQYKLSTLLSKICSDNFSDTPIINNELINKEQVSAPIRKARNTIIDMLLDNTYREFDYSKNAVDCTLFRATIVNKGLIDGEKNYSKDIQIVLNEIKKFILESNDKEISFEKLYSTLISNKKKIGIRKGVLPVYLAFVLKDYKEDVIIYLQSGRLAKKEVVLDSNIIENINNNPKDYYLKLEEGTAEKEIYIDSLMNMFNKYIKNKSVNKYVNLVQGIRVWLQTLSLFSQNHTIDFVTNEPIKDEIIKLRTELVKYDINYRSFIFSSLLKYLNVNDYNECIKKLENIKSYLENHDNRVREHLIKTTKEVINKHYTGTLNGNLIKWYTDLTIEQKEHLYNTETNKFMKFIEEGDHSEIDIVNKFAQIFTGLAIEDWNDNSINLYLSGLKESKKDVESYEAAVESDENEGLIRISFESNDNQVVEKTFNKAEISPIGSTLFNAIDEVIDEYGYSIDDNEKRNILMQILSRYI